MSIYAACLQKSYLELYSGIIARFPLIWEEGSIFCIAFSGELRQLYG